MLLGLTGDQVLPADIYQKIKAHAIATVRGTVQADILKEDQAQNTCIFSTEFALRMNATDRSIIAKLIVRLYVFVVSIALMYLVIVGWKFGSYVFPDVMELLKVAVIPIVTLALGYYFGTKSA